MRVARCLPAILLLVSPAAAWSSPVARVAPTPDAVVPITVVRNKVLVPVRVNGSRPLKLILDTGMGFDGVLLFHPGLKDSIQAGRLGQAKIPGAGGGPPSDAFVADSLTLRIGDLSIPNQRVIILGDTAMTGRTSDGVIGYSLLGHHAVEVDYDALRLVLHDAGSYRPPAGWTPLPITLNEDHRPFLEIAAAVNGDTLAPYRVYIDCASSETIEFLVRPGMTFRVPADATEVLLGRGLSGDVHGRRGTIPRLRIGPHELKDVVAAFVPAGIRSRTKGADAVLANGALCRFDVVFDYARARLLVRPNHFRPHVPR